METLTDVWTQFGAALHRFIAARVNDAHAADDLTQDVLLKVQAGLGDARPDGPLPAWVFAIARNAIIDHYRARAVRSHVGLDGLEPALPTDEGAAEAVRGLAPCLTQMVERLPEPYREALKMVDIEGLSQQEVADRVGVSLSGAKSRVQRARVQLREMIEDCCRIDRDARGNVMDYATTPRSAHYCRPPGDGGGAEAGCGG